MSDDKVMITLSYKGKSVTFDDDTLRRANSALSGGFAGKEDKIGRPVGGTDYFGCLGCGRILSVDSKCRDKEVEDRCVLCCPCQPPCDKESVE